MEEINDKHQNEVGFRIFELQNRVAKPSYVKCSHTLSYELAIFYRNSFFELLTQLRKILNFALG